MSRNEDTVRRIEDLLVSDRASTMLVCIHGGRGTGIYGEICSCYLRETVEFKGAGDLIWKIGIRREVLRALKSSGISRWAVWNRCPFSRPLRPGRCWRYT